MNKLLTFLAVDDGGDHVAACVAESAGHRGGQSLAALGDSVEHCLLCGGVLLHHAQRRPCTEPAEP